MQMISGSESHQKLLHDSCNTFGGTICPSSGKKISDEAVQADCAPFEAPLTTCPKAGPLGNRTRTPLPLQEAQHQLWAVTGAHGKQRSTCISGIGFENVRSERHTRHILERVDDQSSPGNQHVPPRTKNETRASHVRCTLIQCLQRPL